MNKTVSIVVCTYNGEKYLREQLDSILAQTYPLYEIIIQDDGSTDGTLSIAHEYAKQYPDLIHVYEHKIHNGWNINFLDAIKRAAGDYIACADQDDVWEKDKIEVQVREIGDNWLHVCSSYFWNGVNAAPRYTEPGTMADVIFRYYYSGHEFLISKEMMPYVQLGLDVDISHDRLLPLAAICNDKLVTSHYLGVRWRRHEGTATGGELVKKKRSGSHKMRYAMRQLLCGKNSKVLARACNKYVGVFEYLEGEQETLAKVKWYKNLMQCLRDQTIGSYIKAGRYIWLLRDEILRNKASSLNNRWSAFAFSFKWWYIHRDNI